MHPVTILPFLHQSTGWGVWRCHIGAPRLPLTPYRSPFWFRAHTHSPPWVFLHLISWSPTHHLATWSPDRYQNHIDSDSRLTQRRAAAAVSPPFHITTGCTGLVYALAPFSYPLNAYLITSYCHSQYGIVTRLLRITYAQEALLMAHKLKSFQKCKQQVVKIFISNPHLRLESISPLINLERCWSECGWSALL